MLRITLQHGHDEVRLKLEGDLAGAWVPEVEDAWRAAHSTLDGRSLCLDLTAVTHVDGAGKYLLALVRGRGATLVASGTAMKELVRTIAGDWPRHEE
jgi:anti-anti-sigma regulatory factor